MVSKVFAYLIFYILILSYLYIFAQFNNNYVPVWSDEYTYYLNAKSFYENSNLDAAIANSVDGSLYYNFDPHGFAYPLLHGSIAKIFGWDNLNLIITNIIFIVMIILFFLFNNILTTIQKIIAINLFLLFPFISLYSITFMQEIIHVFFAVIMSLLLYKIYNNKSNNHLIIVWLILITLAGLFRPVWFFWVIGLIPLSTSIKKLSLHIILMIFFVFISFYYIYYFFESIPNYFSTLSNLFINGQFSEASFSVLKHVYKNAQNYFSYGYNLPLFTSIVYITLKYLNILSVLIVSYYALITKNRLYIAVSLIGLLNFLLLMFLYDCFSWREIRSMSYLFCFNVLFIVLILRLKSNVIVLVLIIPFTMSLILSKEWIDDRKFCNSICHDKVKTLSKIIEKQIDDTCSVNVLVDFRLDDYSLDILCFPLRNKNDYQIRYIIPYYNKYDVTNKKIDYIVTKNSRNNKYNFQKYFIVDNFHFFKKIK